MKISFLIPLYNDEKNIVRCVESVEKQNYDDIEIVIVNDGSTDNSLEVCKDLNKKYGNIVIVDIPNGGVCNARNILVDTFTGDYALFIDSDDILEEGALNEILEVNKEHNADLVLFDYKNIYMDGTVKDRFKNDGAITLYTNLEAIDEYICKNENFSMVLWRRMYEKSLIKKVKFEDKMLPEDYDTTIDYYYNAKKILHIRKSYYYYYTKDNGLTIRRDLRSYINNFLVKKRVFAKEQKIVKSKNVLKISKENYFKSLLSMSASIYKYQNSSDKEKYFNILKEELKQNYEKYFSYKTKLAYVCYKINKFVFTKIMSNMLERKVKDR